MRIPRIETPLRALFLLGILATSCGSAWAAANNCLYGKPETEISGTGMGGTGTVAKGTGMGGTGISPEARKEMQLAGKVMQSLGDVEAQRNGKSRLLAKGDAVCVGETIVTARSGAAQIKMVDNALVAIRPLTQLRIEKYAYNGSNKDNSLLALYQGAIRMETGKIGRAYPQNDLIRTPNATIGVRGTDHEATVILPGNSEGYAVGTYDKVNSGITFIRTERGEVEIHPDQVGFAASAGKLPTILEEMPGFYRAQPAPMNEGGASEETDRKAGTGENEKAEHMKHVGEGARADHQAERGALAIEYPDVHKGIELPEVPERPELPEPPEHSELPDKPDHPELK